MIFKDIQKEFDYILWLRKRIKALTFGISRQVKTDSTTDFALLTRKLNSYRQEFNFVVDELISLLKNDDLPTQADNIGKESGALSIRSAYSCWQEEEQEARQKANQRRSGGRSQKQSRLGI